MERFAKLKGYSPVQFRRLTGVQRETFEKMVLILKDAQSKRYKVSDRYRNRRKRFGLRFNLIAGIHNFEIKI